MTSEDDEGQDSVKLEKVVELYKAQCLFINKVISNNEKNGRELIQLRKSTDTLMKEGKNLRNELDLKEKQLNQALSWNKDLQVKLLLFYFSARTWR